MAQTFQDDGAKLFDPFFLRDCRYQFLKSGKLGRNVLSRFFIGCEVFFVAGDEIAAAAGFRIFQAACNLVDFVQDLPGVGDPLLALVELFNGANGKPRISCHNQDRGDNGKTCNGPNFPVFHLSL